MHIYMCVKKKLLEESSHVIMKAEKSCHTLLVNKK